MTQICRIISTSTVRPLRENIEHFARRIELTPFDLQLLFADQIQKGLLFHKPAETLSGHFVEHLKDSLSLTLNLFYPLAGRLSKVDNGDDDTVSFFIDCNSAGATFLHAIADGVSVADVLEPVDVPDDVVYSFFPMNGALNCEGISKPLLAVQVTELVDGVFIACTMNHTAVDGKSFWHFFNTWSEISRSHGGEKPALVQVPPVFGRENYLHGVIDLPIRIPSSLVPSSNANFVPPRLQQRMFHFGKDEIARLKAKANAEIGTNKISSLQAVLAHLWISITRNRLLNADEEVTYCILIGLRPRMVPPLPEEYLGNAVLLGEVKSLAGKLVEGGLGSAAREINKMIASTAEEEVWKFLEDWTKSPRFKTLGRFPSNMLVTGSSPRFDVYGNDFGWGRPIAVRSGPGNKFDGKITVFAGAEEGSIDFEACLSPQTLEAMADDAEFIQFLSGTNY
ncbi:hypothetical protein TIFTF001_002753 [Ficus carica]|uniref:HXXXD-type acyl-transferase family protein n=1 Tax=Ficus carica TaxID=3494 RepID=A0AA88D8L2_FICCA|nr:hypothetical protein TIFTF001_002753 [Ficus carica]